MKVRIPGVHFEAVAEPATSSGGSVADVEIPEDLELGDPADVEETPAADETPVADEAPAFDQEAWLASPEGQQAVLARAEQMLDTFREEPAPAEQEETLRDVIARLDPLDDNFGQQLAQVLEDRERRMIGELQQSPAIQHAEMERAQAWANDTFAQIERDLKLPEGQHLGDADRELAISAAVGIAPTVGGDPARALAESAKRIHQLRQTERQAAVEAYKASLLEGGGTPAEPGVSTGAAVQINEPQKDYDGIVDKWFPGG